MSLAYLADSQQERVADLLFDAETGLGLQIVRYNIGGSNTTLNATNSMRPFAAVPSMLLANGTYNWTLVSQPAQADHMASLLHAQISSAPHHLVNKCNTAAGSDTHATKLNHTSKAASLLPKEILFVNLVNLGFVLG